MYSWSFSEHERDLLKTLEKKLWKFVETALYALRRKNWCKNFFWKIWNLYYSFRFRERKLTTGLCEFHSTCTEEKFGKKFIMRKFINFRSFRTLIQSFSDYWTKKFCQVCRSCLLFVGRTIFWWNFLCGKKYMVFWLFQILTKNFSDFNKILFAVRKKYKTWNRSLNFFRDLDFQGICQRFRFSANNAGKKIKRKSEALEQKSLLRWSRVLSAFPEQPLENKLFNFSGVWRKEIIRLAAKTAVLTKLHSTRLVEQIECNFPKKNWIQEFFLNMGWKVWIL